MYLTQFDRKTGLLDIEDIDDGVMSIKEFRDLVNSKEFGLPCLTAVALVADYKSPIKYYDDNDRPKKAMEEVTGQRKAWEWNLEIIQVALKKYDALQYDPVLEEGRIYFDQKVKKLKEIQAYDNLPKDDPRRQVTRMSDLKKELRAINTDIDDYNKRIKSVDLYENSAVKNGYKLSRLEQKLLKSNSFYNQVR